MTLKTELISCLNVIESRNTEFYNVIEDHVRPIPISICEVSVCANWCILGHPSVCATTLAIKVSMIWTGCRHAGTLLPDISLHQPTDVMLKTKVPGGHRLFGPWHIRILLCMCLCEHPGAAWGMRSVWFTLTCLVDAQKGREPLAVAPCLLAEVRSVTKQSCYWEH